MIKNVPMDFLRENANRYRKLIRGEHVDYAPFRLWLDSTFVFWFTGVDPREYSRSLEVQLATQKAVNDRFYDLRDFSVDIGTFDIFFDFERFAADHPGAASYKVLVDDLDNFDKYYQRQTDFNKIKGVQELSDGIVYFNKNLPKHKQVSHYFGISGAMDLYSIVRGTENFFTDLYDNPAKVKKIFNFFTERSLAWLEFDEKKWGHINRYNNLYDKVDIGEDYCAYLPQELFKEFVEPHTGALFAKYKGKVCRSLHTDGDFVTSGIGHLNNINCDELMGFSPNIDIKEFRKALPNMILGGNLHPIKVMIEGTPETVKSVARYCFEQANQNQKFVLCTGGAITAGAKSENVDAFIEATWEVVKYDTAPVHTIKEVPSKKPARKDDVAKA